MTQRKTTCSRRQTLAGIAGVAASLPLEHASTAETTVQLRSTQNRGRGALATDRTALETFTGMAAGQVALLGEPGREGIFIFNSSNLSAEIAADPQQGIYVAPTTDTTGASGAWVRKFEGPVNPAWFGLAEANSGVANDTAIQGVLATLKARAVNVDAAYQGLEAIRFPVGEFTFASTIDIFDGTTILEGQGNGGAGGRPTMLVFPTGVTGIRVQQLNTSGASTVDSTNHMGGDATIIRSLALKGAYGSSSTEAEAHGIHLRARATIEDVRIDSFEGDGIYSLCVFGGVEGNSNSTQIRGGRISKCRNGIFLDGDNSNIWHVSGTDIVSCRQWGVRDSSFLGNAFFGVHTDSCGTAVGSYTPSVVSHGGNRYGVIHGQEAGASTNSPSGSTTHNTWWYYLSTGGANTSTLNIPLWVSGTTYRSGGAFNADNANGRSVFVGCYHEGGQGWTQLITTSGNSVPALVFGGLQADYVRGGSVFKTALGVLQLGSTLFTDAGGGQVSFASAANVYQRFYDATAFPGRMQIQKNGGDLLLAYGSSANPIVRYTGPNTTEQFGTGSVVPYAFRPSSLMVGNSEANARLLTNDIAAPSSGSHGRGEVALNLNAAVGSPAGWACVTAGTPGTWSTIPGQADAPATTYAPPSGGTTVDAQARVSLAQLAADVGDLKTKLAAAGAIASFADNHGQ